VSHFGDHVYKRRQCLPPCQPPGDGGTSTGLRSPRGRREESVRGINADPSGGSGVRVRIGARRRPAFPQRRGADRRSAGEDGFAETRAGRATGVPRAALVAEQGPRSNHALGASEQRQLAYHAEAVHGNRRALVTGSHSSPGPRGRGDPASPDLAQFDVTPTRAGSWSCARTGTSSAGVAAGRGVGAAPGSGQASESRKETGELSSASALQLRVRFSI